MGYFASLAQGIGTQAATSGLGILYNRLGASYDRQQQAKQQEQQMGIQMRGEQEMMKFANAQQLKMWEATGYGAQRDQMERAGLNPALMYGMGGGGGQTAQASTGAPVGGASPDTRNTTGMGIGSITEMANLELMKSQANKNNADADATRANMPNIPIQGKLLGANIENLAAQTQNEQAKNALLQLDKSLKEIELRVSGATETNRVILTDQEVQKLTAEAETATNIAGITQETKDSVINEVKARALGAILDNTLKQKNIELTEQQINEIKQTLLQNPEYLDIAKREIAVKELMAKNQMTLGIANAIIDGVTTAVGIGALNKLFKGSRTVIQGFKTKSY